jgi:hypothetical protein
MRTLIHILVMLSLLVAPLQIAVAGIDAALAERQRHCLHGDKHARAHPCAQSHEQMDGCKHMPETPCQCDMQCAQGCGMQSHASPALPAAVLGDAMPAGRMVRNSHPVMPPGYIIDAEIRPPITL